MENMTAQEKKEACRKAHERRLYEVCDAERDERHARVYQKYSYRLETLTHKRRVYEEGAYDTY